MNKKTKEVMIFIFCMFVGIMYAYADGNCDGVFGDPNRPGSLGNMIREYLGWFRILAPVLVIAFGSVDLFKAVIASNPDQIKKAQNDFIRRLVIGVGLFFIPSLVNLIIYMSGSGACKFNW